MSQRIPDPVPGALLKDILDEMNISQAELARRTGITASHVTAIIKGRQGINAEVSLRLGRFFGQSDTFWLNIQHEYDLRKARDEKGPQIDKEVLPLAY
ncbi:MAG: HigA family addiction module antitoxin [Verrucomicrobiota bacterium JB024]|nr:HigA family addiction module antitoxin [Verrucomicrobiota bacterium JB024]